MDKQRTEVLAARDVWKVFGADGDRCIRTGPIKADEEIRKGGRIIGVREASFSIARGEIFIIMGLSGSGKSTLLRCLTALQPASRGSITIDGMDLASASAAELMGIRRRKISMVFQSFALLPHLTALENTAFPLRVRKVPRHRREEQARSALALVGLSEREGRYPSELSGGQQQRVGIARSLVTDPEVWFLDEPFSALDPLIRREMQNEFRRLQSQLHKTIVFVTHDLEEAVRLGDRIAIMQDGRILQIGTPADLMLRPFNDYVRRFVSGIPKERVLTVGAVASAIDGCELEDAPIQQNHILAEAAARIILSEKPIAVVDQAGERIGKVSRAERAQWLA